MKAMLNYTDARDILEKYGFTLPEGAPAKTQEEAAEIINRLGFPVTINSTSEGVSGASVLNSKDDAMKEYRKISSAEQNQGAIVQSHKKNGMEAVIGMIRDAELGPIIRFSLSGVFAYLNDTSSRVAPVSKEDAFQMIKENGAYEIIRGNEKRKNDIEAIADAIENLSRMSMENDNIMKIEINPLFVYEKGVLAGSARVEVG